MDLFVATKVFRAHRIFAYAAALVGPLAAYLLREALSGPLTGLPFLTFFPPILIAAFLGGWAPGLLAAALSGTLAHLFFMDAHMSAADEPPSHVLGLVFFGLVAVTMIALVSELRRFNDDLEARVGARTRELAAANVALLEEIRTREASEALVRQTQKIEAIGQLTGGIAHDFNNMLAVVIGNLDIAARRLGQGGDALRFVRNARDGAEKSAALTRRLLAFSRRQPLSPTIIDLNELIAGMGELLRLSVGPKVELVVRPGAQVWPVLADPAELENAVVNLAVNARDAMPDGGRLTIETFNGEAPEPAPAGEDASASYAVIAVADTGEGMTEDVAARAFEPFFTTKEIGKGSGLGLSQVYGFVKQSGGNVRIASRPGEGTRVEMRLPRGATAAKAPGGRDCVPSGPGGGGETILVVEDDDGVRGATIALLRDLGYGVREAASGPEALAVLDEADDVSLLFTDVVMPGMSGRELAELAARRRPGLKVLYTTGFTRGVLAEGDNEPKVDLIMKPFALDQLARKVRGALDR
ncbi:ATP-binding protein [Methylocella sp.]|uniref:ATP-binding protein n=1 Tax=Methylocella sp. TaxID=1978226 RepID=UPI0035B05072